MKDGVVCVTKLCGRGGGGGGGGRKEERTGYRNKNKNPTQRYYTTINFWDILGTQILEESMCSPQFFPWFTTGLDRVPHNARNSQ